MSDLVNKIQNLYNEVLTAELELGAQIRTENDFMSIWSIAGRYHHMDRKSFMEGLTLRYKDFFDEFDVSVTIEGPTWLDAWKAADQAIRESGDCHHVFIERLDVARDADGNRVVVLQTGS